MTTTHPLAADSGASAPAEQATAPASTAYLVYIVLLLTLTNALSYADRQLFAILIPAIKAEFAAGDATIGLLAGPAFMVAYVCLSMPLARLADRGSRRKVLAMSVLLWSAATAFCGAATNLALLALGRMGVGVGEAGGSPPAQSMIAGAVPSRHRSLALGVFTTGTYIGVVAGMWGGAALVSMVGWRHTFMALALPGLLLAPLVWATCPRRPDNMRQLRGAGPGAVLLHCWQIRSFRLIALGAGTMNIFAYAASVWMPSYLIRSHGLSLVQAGAWNGLSAAAGGISGSLAAGLLADRLAARDPRFQLLVPAAGLLAAVPCFAAQLCWPAGWTASLGGATIPIVALFSLPAAFCMGLWMPAGFAAVQSLVPPAMRAQAAALLIVILFLVGGVLGPILTGAISDALAARAGQEALRYGLLISEAAILAGAMLFIRAARTYPDDLHRATAGGSSAPMMQEKTG